MFRLISRVIKDVSTEKDGESFDTARILWVIGTLIFFGLTIYTTIVSHGAAFNMINFGIAFGGILTGGGAAIKIKETTEQPMPNGGVQVDTAMEKN